MRRAKIKPTVKIPVRQKLHPENVEIKQEFGISENLIKIEDFINNDNNNDKEIKCEKIHRNEFEINEKEKENVMNVEKIIEETENNNETINNEKIVEKGEETIVEKEVVNSENEKSRAVESPKKIEVAVSPTKTTNRSFIRPIPRLDGPGRIRRNSIHGSGASASESEDDSKRQHLTQASPVTSNRTRTESVCSVQSVQSNFDGRRRDFGVPRKRKSEMNESSRKLAKKRREFLMNGEDFAHDKSKLTMYDLLYYNPKTNPMKPKPIVPVTKKAPTVQLGEEGNDESIEDPPDTEDVSAPQVTLGPNGEIIIDEQSLVVERKQTDDREVIHVDANHCGGFYKRRKVRKEWTGWETMKFYKALATIGPDFLLMESMFPKRSRKELKIKFKYEEKKNKDLVQKALLCQEFDPDSLKKDLASFDEQEAEANKFIEEKKQKTDEKNSKKRRSQTVPESDDEADKIDETEPEPEPDVQNCEETEDSGTDSEIYKPQPTRSGRVPRSRRLQAPETNSLDAPAAPIPRTLDDVLDLVPNPSEIKPGSLIVITKESDEDPNKKVLQIFMVDKNYDKKDPNSPRNITLVDNTPELLATVTTKVIETEGK